MMNLRWSDGWRIRFSGLVLIGVFVLLVAGPAAAAESVDIYQQDVPVMTTLECAKCHVQVFEDLRDGGGLHKQQCRDCHDKFHTFTPGVPWEDRVPACSDCHEFPHGESINACLECHANAHAPITGLIAAEKMADLCKLCHQKQVDELSQGENAHNSQTCFECHQGERHGERPQCSLCHEDAHAEYVDNAGCAACHPPHTPADIAYDNKVPNSLCGGCHVDQQQIQQNSQKKHKELACVICHAEHGQIPECQECHGTGPHNEVLLKNFNSCGECHGDPHKLQL